MALPNFGSFLSYRTQGSPILPTSFQEFKGAVLCLLIAGTGGVIAGFLYIPLPYMLGSMAAAMAAAMLKAPIARPGNLFIIPMRVLLGVLIGSAVTPALFDNTSAILGTAALAPLYVIAAGLFGMFYYRKIAGFEREQAFFCALPGGLLIMTTLADDSGIDIKRISLAHAMRITFVVISLPFLARIFLDIDVVDISKVSVSILDMPLYDISLLLAAGVIGFLVAEKMHLPAGQVIGPLFASAILHFTGLIDSKPPQELINAAQVILGAYIGARFINENLSMVRSSILLAAGHVAVMLTMSILLAFMLYSFFDLPMMVGVMSFAPGGLPENSLIAFGLGLDVGFIATVQVVRLLFISLFTPFLYLRIKHLLH